MSVITGGTHLGDLVYPPFPLGDLDHRQLGVGSTGATAESVDEGGVSTQPEEQ